MPHSTAFLEHAGCIYRRALEYFQQGVILNTYESTPPLAAAGLGGPIWLSFDCAGIT